MKGFAPLFRKEIREQLKLYRLVIVCAIFLFFAISCAADTEVPAGHIEDGRGTANDYPAAHADSAQVAAQIMPAISVKSARWLRC